MGNRKEHRHFNGALQGCKPRVAWVSYSAVSSLYFSIKRDLCRAALFL